MEYLQIAEEFGKLIWTNRKKLKIEDIMLFGSVSYKKPNPSDLDLLILHYNFLLDGFQNISDSKKINSMEKLCMLSELFKKDINLLEIFKGTNVEKLISQNKFNVKYMSIRFFTNLKYKENWNLQNNDPNFAMNIFRQGKLWNQKTKKYDMLALNKYKIF